MLHLAGKNHESEATLARKMLRDILGWFPDRKLVFLGDGAYSAKNLLADLSPRVTYVGQVTATAGRFSDSNVSSDSNPGPLETVFYSLKGRFGRWYSTDVSKG
jgi:hypothetical protein